MAKIKPDRIVIYIVDECINGNDETEIRLFRGSRGVPVHFDTFDAAQQYIDNNIPDNTTTYENGVTWHSHAVSGMLKNSPLISASE